MSDDAARPGLRRRDFVLAGAGAGLVLAGPGPLNYVAIARAKQLVGERVLAKGTGRILVRPSGTEPIVRVLAEAETAEAAEELCARIAALVTRELG